MVTTNDPAGAAFNLLNAVNRHTQHTCRLVTTETRYNFLYRKDLHLPLLSDYSELEQLLKTCDVIHFHMTSDENMVLGPFKVANYIAGKRIVHHHHGEPLFRSSPDSFRQREQKLGRTALVSTPDLLELYPEARWLPNPVPLNDVLYMPAPQENSLKERDVVRITHSPTRRDLKNTDDFLGVVNSLLSNGHKISFKLIENMPHETALRIKRLSDICFDHMQGYYGVSSLEALSQGVATIAGLSDRTISFIKDFTGCNELPWVIARNSAELKGQITRLIYDRAELRRYKIFSREWMVKYWTEKAIADLYISFIS